MSQTKFYGTGVALVTPFTVERAVDFNALERLVEHVVSNGVEYVVVFGTTGEPVTLKQSEKQDVLHCVKGVVAKRVPIVVGCGGNNTADVVDNLNNGMLNGVDAVLSVTPYYNKPSQKGLVEHYRIIAKNSPAPLIIYNVPGRTGLNMEASTSIEIANTIEGVIGLKEASPSVEQFTYIKKDVPADFLIISGDDSIVLPHLSLGAAGAISVTANAMPALYSDMVRLALEGNFTEALKTHLKLIEFTDHLFVEGSPSGVKAALNIQNIMEPFVRLPLTEVSDVLHDKLKSLTENILT